MKRFWHELEAPVAQKRTRTLLELHVGNASSDQSPYVSPASNEEESGPLGLKLRRSSSFLDLVQVTLAHENNPKNASPCSVVQSQEKKKATNFSASVLRIGAWEYMSRYECDLVVKCYFAKRKLVWEVLDAGLKSKIEIQWSDITGIQATFPNNKPSTLEVEVVRPPMFFKESNPQPRKHTIWQATSDFTGGQATVFRRHMLQFPNGAFERHYENLLLSDSRLSILSKKGLPPQHENRFVTFAPQHNRFLAMLQATSKPVDFQNNHHMSASLFGNKPYHQYEPQSFSSLSLSTPFSIPMDSETHHHQWIPTIKDENTHMRQTAEGHHLWNAESNAGYDMSELSLWRAQSFSHKSGLNKFRGSG